MLGTRLWVGTVLAAVGLAVLVADERLAPWYPGWFVLILCLNLVTCRELAQLCQQQQAVPAWLAQAGVLLILLANWFPHVAPLFLPPLFVGLDPWACLLMALTGYFLFVFWREMYTFQGPDRALTRMALLTWAVLYLGVLPSFAIQLRWLPGANQLSTVALALTVFIPKSCDVGAYFAGKYLGRHRLSPMLSPKKTWEGVLGGLAVAVLAAVLIDRLAPAAPLHRLWWAEVGFGVTVGGAGVLGDLAESMIKRDCHTKDASAMIPGFGGMLDVIDAILFAAPVAYLWIMGFDKLA